MSGFSIDWLDLREPADRRARDERLRARAAGWLQEIQPPTKERIVVDLGAGTGATLRALIELQGNQPEAPIWRLVDQDEELLAAARRRHGDSHRLELCPADLALTAALPLDNVSLITASALFDLVSEQFLSEFIAELQSRRRQQRFAVYAALNYDGTTLWSRDHGMDAAVLEAFNRDQHRDKGFGPALGPEAGACMQQLLSQAGFAVEVASSPWLLHGDDENDARLMQALIEGIASAVAADTELDPTALADWKEFRQKNVIACSCEVGHSDLLALPE